MVKEPAPPADRAAHPALPDWATQMIALYESGAASQFILYGNVHDRFLLPPGREPVLGSLSDFLLHVLLPGFDVVLSYDIGNGTRVERGGEAFARWPHFKEKPAELPRDPRAAVELLTRYFRYAANLTRLGKGGGQIACLVRDAHLVAPSLGYGFSYDLNALALLMREWAVENLLTGHPFATVLIADNLNDLHPLLVNNPRVARLKIPLPPPADIERLLGWMRPAHPAALEPFAPEIPAGASQLAGATLSSVESLVKTRDFQKRALSLADLGSLKKELIEKDTNDLIEFLEPDRSLDDLHGQDTVKAWFRQDIELWRRDELGAMPMGYLLCGPVGTGKTYMVECLAGEAGVPVVKFKNFRDRWVGSTESNLETIFRLLHALGRCFVFIDEADQALGRRDAGREDSGVSGRVYGMMAEEMSNTRNRGRIVWVLASSRPDLIEVDLKRPGRVDVKIPLFPTSTPEEGFHLIRALCKKRGLAVPAEALDELRGRVPNLMTPGAAEALAVKVFRRVKVAGLEPVAALRECLEDYQNPVPLDILEFQIRIAVREASDLEFVPLAFREAGQG